MGFVGTKPTISSNVVISDGGTIGSASDEDAIAIAADGSVTFTQDIELGHASDTTIARSGSGDITIEGNAVYRAGGTDVPVADGGTGQSTLNNLITMGSHTTGNYVASITAGTGLTSDGATSGESIAHSLSVDASQTQITAVGTIATGVWQGTAIASAYLDSDTAHLSGTQTFSGAKTFTSTITVGVDDTGHDVKFFGATSGKYMEWDESANQLDITGSFDVTGNSSMVGTLTVGVDDTGHDVKFFGATSGKYMEWDESANQLDVTGSLDVTGNTSMVGTLTIGVDDTGHDVKFFGASAGAYMEWDESADQLRIMGAEADATTSTGKLLLATSLTDINANDVLGKVEFQAPHEAGGTDAITVAAGIEAVAQGTFSSSVNATDILFKTGHSEAATEKFRFTSQGEIGIGGTNYGTDGQVLTSGGAGAAPAWEDAASPAGSFTATANGAVSAGDLVGIGTDGKVSTLEAAANINDMCTNAIPDTLTDLHDTSSSNTRGLTVAYDPDNSKGVLIWREGSSTYDLMAAVVSLNTTTGAITIGSEAILHNGSSGLYANYSMGLPCIEYDTTADRFLVFFALWNSSGSSYRSFNAIVVDIDGTSIVSGTSQVVQANTTGGWGGRGGAEFMTGRGHMALAYARTSYTGDGGSVVTGTRGGYIDVLTLDNSDNSFTTASSTKIVAGYDQQSSVAWDSVNGRFYYVHLDGSDDFMGMVVEHDNSDDSLTAGSDALINGDPTTDLEFGVNYWLSAGQMAVFYSVGGSNDTDATPLGTYLQLFTVSGSGQTGTLSSNRTTVRTEKQHHDGFSMDAFSDLTTGNLDNMLALVYMDNAGTTSYIDLYSYVASGVTVEVVVDAETISTDQRHEECGGILSNGKGLSLIFVENTDTSQLRYITPSLTNSIATTSGKHYTRWIGIANSAISDAATGTITSVGGTGTGQSSLTIGSMYVVNSSAGLTAASNFYSDTGYSKVGVALSATTIYITGGFSD